MGAPKALLPYRGRTFVEHLLKVTQHPRVSLTRIIVGAHAAEIRQKLGSFASLVVENPDWQHGQLSSIHAAIRSLPPGGTEGMILCPVDHPIVSAVLVAQLIKVFDSSGKPIVLPTHQGKRGHPLIFRSTLYDELLAASPDVGARQVVWAHAANVMEVPTDEEGVTLNLNDPEILRKVLGESS